MSRKAFASIPKVKLQMRTLMRKADMQSDICSYDSETSSPGHAAGYAADETGVLVMTTSNGYLRIPYEDIGTVIEELKCIQEDIEYWKSVGGLKKYTG